MEQAQRELARELHLLFRLDLHRPLDVDVLAGLLRKAPGSCPVYVTVKDLNGKRCVLRLGRDCYINPAAYPRDELETLLGHGAVQLR
jgi:DNA polymerase-3 subunit alpha